jgi:peroxiredoxin
MKSFFTSVKSLWIPIIVIGLLAILFTTLSDKKQAPEITFTTIEGKKITMSSLKGQVVLVNFWATDCPGCIAEMPKLVETYNQYHAKGLEIIAVAMPTDPISQVQNYVQKNKLPFPVVHDDNEDITSHFDDVRLTPTTFMIDRQGHLMGKIIGEMDFTALKTQLEKSLANNTKEVL